MIAVCPVCGDLYDCGSDENQHEPCKVCWSIGWRPRPGGVYFRAPTEQPETPPFQGETR